jgi:hypothetical protein
VIALFILILFVLRAHDVDRAEATSLFAALVALASGAVALTLRRGAPADAAAQVRSRMSAAT